MLASSSGLAGSTSHHLPKQKHLLRNLHENLRVWRKAVRADMFLQLLYKLLVPNTFSQIRQPLNLNPFGQEKA